MKKRYGFTQHLHLSNSRKVQCIGITCFIILISSIIACTTPQKKEYRVLKIYGNGAVANFTKSFALMSTECGITQPGGLMVEEGDLLCLGGWTLTYNSSLLNADKALHFVISDSLLLINGQLAGLCIDTAYEVRKMLPGIDKTIVQNLKVLAISTAGFDVYKKEIKELGAINPKCGLILSETFSDDALAELLGWFSPGTLNATLTGQQHHLLKTESQLASLFITNTDSILTAEPFPSLPNLKTFVHHFNGDSVSPTVLHNPFLANNPQIENVCLFNWNTESDSNQSPVFLQPLKQLKGLMLADMHIADSEILAHSATLERLWVRNAYLQLQMPRLRWATVGSEDDTQQLLDSIISTKPGVQVLEIFSPDRELNLSGISRLKSLQALTLVDDDSADIAPLFELKGLKMLSYSSDKGNTDSAIQILRAALPSTLVVHNDGFCVGSGYLVLLLPMLAIALLMAKGRQKENHATA